MSDAGAVRGPLTLCAVVATCFVVWLLGAMWQEARTLSGSASGILSPGPALWLCQLGLVVLLYRPSSLWCLQVGGVVLFTFLPIWVLLFLIESASLTTLLWVHMSALTAVCVLGGSAVILSKHVSPKWRQHAVAGVQVLCLSALFGVSSDALNWIF